MKLALLGNDELLLQLAQAAAKSEAHRVACLCEAGDWASDVLEMFPAANIEGDWETLLLGEEADVVVVGRPTNADSPLRIEQLRRLVQEGVPMVVVHPAAEAIALHELAMIQNDTQSPLTAWNPVADSWAADRLLKFFRHGEDNVGSISELSLRRTAPKVSKELALELLAQDAELIERLTGPIDRVTALSPPCDHGVASLAVTMGGAGPVVVQWTLQPGESSSSRMQVVGPHNCATLELPSSTGQGRLVVDASGKQDEITVDQSAPAGPQLLAAIDAFLAESNAPARWNRACRSVEVAEAASESLRRGRTIQLHQHEHSEQQTFKGVMAAGGCLVLLGVLLLLALSILIDGLGAGVRNNPWWRLWPVALLTPVVLFLLLQLLWRVFPKRQ